MLLKLSKIVISFLGISLISTAILSHAEDSGVDVVVPPASKVQTINRQVITAMLNNPAPAVVLDEKRFQNYLDIYNYKQQRSQQRLQKDDDVELYKQGGDSFRYLSGSENKEKPSMARQRGIIDKLDQEVKENVKEFMTNLYLNENPKKEDFAKAVKLQDEFHDLMTKVEDNYGIYIPLIDRSANIATGGYMQLNSESLEKFANTDEGKAKR